MDRRSSTEVTPDRPAEPSRSTATIPARLAADDMHRACGIAQAVVEIAFGQPQPRQAATRTPGRAEAFARQVAMYLSHVGFGIPMAAIGKAFGRDRTTVVHACHLVEDRRDEARFDILLDCLEQAAAALQAADRLKRQD